MTVRRSELAEVFCIQAHCENCGRRRRFDRKKVQEFERTFATLEDLGRKVVCRECKSRGRRNHRNISLIPYFRGEPLRQLGA